MEQLHEDKPNPLVALVAVFQDGARLRFGTNPPVQQEHVMIGVGQLLGRWGVEFDVMPAGTSGTVRGAAMILHIRGDQITTVYDERLDLRALGPASIRRASHVEPTPDGRWTADMGPVAPGIVLGPFALRSQALAAEAAWLEERL